MLKTRYITIALMIMLALSISAFMAITLAYQQFPIGLRNLYELGTYLPAVEQLQTWFCATVLAFIAILPDMFVKVQCDWSEFATGNAVISQCPTGNGEKVSSSSKFEPGQAFNAALAQLPSILVLWGIHCVNGSFLQVARNAKTMAKAYREGTTAYVVNQ